jgi:3-deoxy-D-manno-octulosonate 8-phosphate phosphatase (KDO 8-P phosphatase)
VEEPLWKTDLNAACQRIKLVAMDVDGTLTDGRIYFTEQGDFIKSFDAADGWAFAAARKAGLILALATGRRSETVRARAREFKVAPYNVIQGMNNKGDALKKLCRLNNVTLEECAFIGDDYVDAAGLKVCGLPLAVANAPDEIKALSAYVSNHSGGDSAVRELLVWLLREQGKLKQVVDWYLAQ